jgi:ketosteroid isomerase-like protein
MAISSDDCSLVIEQAVNAGDAAVLTALYTKDAALLPDGIATPQIGEISIRRYFDDFVKITRRNLSLLVTESKMLSPDGVFMVGTWSAEVAAPLRFLGRRSFRSWC